MPGTTISNRADFLYEIGGEIRRGSSNTVAFTVAERLDVGVSADSATPIPIASVPTTVTATVTNLGSGREALDLSVRPSGGVRVEQLAIDRDGDARFDAAVDQPLAGTTPVLAPGEALHLVAVIAATDAPVDGTLVIGARAQTGSGEVDQLFPGRGDEGGDAVVGPTGATAGVTLPLVAGRSAPTLAKQQSVRAPDGSARPISGAIVTYTLVATLPAGSAREARIEDPVPAGTRYVANSLTLDGAALSDAADADAGECDGRLVAVALAVPIAAATHAVTFQVRLP
ncbi:hypothetical protein [Sphingomonas rubra]|uniref:hypothetical protein n=1 Tax=Sphingomonas rubra TaxID=634430 RepID=UPI0015A524B5|nr:hypothetical protein [Sphingomonas rubra]